MPAVTAALAVAPVVVILTITPREISPTKAVLLLMRVRAVGLMLIVLVTDLLFPKPTRRLPPKAATVRLMFGASVLLVMVVLAAAAATAAGAEAFFLRDRDKNAPAVRLLSRMLFIPGGGPKILPARA